MKLKQIQEAKYHNQDLGWAVHLDLDNEDVVVMFPSREDALVFLDAMGKKPIQWFEDNNIDTYTTPLKIMSPQQIRDVVDL